MILRFTVRNHKSFFNTNTLELIPTSLKELKDNIGIIGKYKYLKTIAIYGANAAGKSNIIDGLFTMSYLVQLSSEFKTGRKINVYDPFFFDKKKRKEPTELSLTFILDEILLEGKKLNNILFEYSFTFNEEEFISEELYFYPKGQKSLIYKRNNNTFKFGDYYKGERAAIINILLPNQLFLSKSALFKIPLLNSVYSYFENNIVFPVSIKELEFITNTFFKNSSLKMNLKNMVYAMIPSMSIEEIENITPEDKKLIAEIISAFDTGIVDFEIKKKQSPNFLEQLLNLEKQIVTYHKNTEGQIQKFTFERESSGTQWLFALAKGIVDVLKHGGIYIIDEFEKNLHPNIVSVIVELFNSATINKHNAQLIFTTHSTEILDKKLLRRDQIWFVEKDEYGKSELFSLSDFSDVRFQNDIKEWYINGRFGATPMVDKYSILKAYEEASKK